MLKLEKISKTREISIRMRKRDRVCNPIFLRAFAIALTIHLIGLGVVNIESFKIKGSDRWRPPAIVNAEIEGSFNALTQLESGIRRRSFLEPKESIPALPVMPEPIYLRNIESINKKGKTTTINPFRPLEKSLTESFDVKPLTQAQPIIVRASGLLADKIFNLEQIDSSVSSNLLKDSKTARFKVQVEGKSGQIFWHEIMQSTELADLDHLAEQMLRQIRFKAEANSFVTSGEIEIQFNPSETL